LVITQVCINQSFEIKIVSILLLKSEGFEWDCKMLVSSADFKGTDLSHTDPKMRKTKDHKTKP